jgi:hypothetical protein
MAMAAAGQHEMISSHVVSRRLEAVLFSLTGHLEHGFDCSHQDQ